MAKKIRPVLAERLKQAREDLGVKQEEIESEMNIQQATLSKYENGGRVPIEILVRLAGRYQKPVDHFIEKIDDRYDSFVSDLACQTGTGTSEREEDVHRAPAQARVSERETHYRQSLVGIKAAADTIVAIIEAAGLDGKTPRAAQSKAARRETRNRNRRSTPKKRVS